EVVMREAGVTMRRAAVVVRRAAVVRRRAAVVRREAGAVMRGAGGVRRRAGGVGRGRGTGRRGTFPTPPGGSAARRRPRAVAAGAFFVPPSLRSGDRCHVYEVIASLGTSGAAELYLVREPFGEPCVLKLMEAPGADKQRLRFVQEGVILAKIAHANVVKVLGA